jgi:hypothetical protein
MEKTGTYEDMVYSRTRRKTLPKGEAMKKFTIQIREEVKAFSKSHLSEALNLSNSTLNSLIANGKISCPTGYNKKFLIEDLKTIFKELNYKPIVKLHGKTKRDWAELKNSRMVIRSGGIFLVSPVSYRENQIKIENTIKEYGLWNAQGLNNHEHLREYIKNPILQLILSENIINIWIEQVRKLQPKERVVIYWNGSVDSTVCIYLMPKTNKKFLVEHDKYLRMRKCRISEVSEKESWNRLLD